MAQDDGAADLSILIVNYETDRLLRECCASLIEGAEGLEWEAIVVDNDSQDGSADFLEHQDDPRFHLIRSDRNLGFAAGNNLALEEAGGRLVLLLNPDTWVHPYCLTRLVRHLDSRPDLGAVCPRTWIDGDRTLEVCSLKIPGPALALTAFTFWGRLPLARGTLERAWSIDRRLAATRQGAVRVEGIGGACLLTRRALLDELSGLDPAFYMGYEDTDLSYRLRARGLHLEILVDAEMVHYFGYSKRKRGPRDAHLYRWDRGPLTFLRKHYHPFWGGLFRGIKTLEERGRRQRDRRASQASEPREVLLRWEGGPAPYLVEISNTPRFLDSFLAVRQEPLLRIPREVIQRLAPAVYHWRASPLDAPAPRRPLGRGSFCGISAPAD